MPLDQGLSSHNLPGQKKEKAWITAHFAAILMLLNVFQYGLLDLLRGHELSLLQALIQRILG
jgi:hypothetical protein